MIPPRFIGRLTLWLTLAAAVAILFSIAISQILLAMALGALFLSGLPLRWPRVTLPFGCFLIWTLVALAFSPDPHQGLAQVRKMVVFVVLLIVYSVVRTSGEAILLLAGWMLAGSLTAARGLIQYARDVAGAAAAHENFYQYYVADRIRGFMSHWMTFSGQELFVLLFALSMVLFAPGLRRRGWLAVPCLLLTGTALLLSDTRSVWIAAIAGGFYLLWNRDKRAAIGLPVLIGLILLVAPAQVKERAVSIIRPTTQTDSNTHRIIVWRTGLRMMEAHPLTGVGPEMIRKPEVFYAYVPADIPRPLPDGFYEHLHNIYIHYGAECGIPAALALIWMFVMALMDFRKGLRGLPEGRGERRFLLQGAIACVIGTMVAGIFEKNLGDTEVLTMFLAILCIGYLAAQEPRTA